MKSINSHTLMYREPEYSPTILSRRSKFFNTISVISSVLVSNRSSQSLVCNYEFCESGASIKATEFLNNPCVQDRNRLYVPLPLRSFKMVLNFKNKYYYCLLVASNKLLTG